MSGMLDEEFAKFESVTETKEYIIKNILNCETPKNECFACEETISGTIDYEVCGKCPIVWRDLLDDNVYPQVCACGQKGEYRRIVILFKNEGYGELRKIAKVIAEKEWNIHE
jgi:hypothetical protein